jgi:preprotein translocase subunit YajC
LSRKQETDARGHVDRGTGVGIGDTVKLSSGAVGKVDGHSGDRFTVRGVTGPVTLANIKKVTRKA